MLSLREYINNPRILFTSLLREYGGWIPDRLYLQMLYYLKMGKRLNLDNPQTFSEKIQWLKLYDRKSQYAMMVDKYSVKGYVEKIIGLKYIIPTLGIWSDPEKIDFDGLPEKFVLKVTNGGGGGGVYICKNKMLADRAAVVEKMRKVLRADIYRAYREWPYKQVHPRVIAEPLIENPDNRSKDLIDYKFFCFGGVPKYCQVIKDRNTRETIDFFDLEWNHQPFFGLNPIGEPVFVPSSIEPEKPIHLDEMIWIASKLSKDTFFSRIDLYDTPAGPFFGEITFYPASGMGVFTPYEYNDILGEMIHLS